MKVTYGAPASSCLRDAGPPKTFGGPFGFRGFELGDLGFAFGLPLRLSFTVGLVEKAQDPG